MLVITRKLDQSMVLGSRVHITVVEVLSSAIILEIRGPRNTKIQWEKSNRRHSVTATGGEQDVWVTLDPHGAILIDREITVTLIEVRQEKARLGFIAPKHISVLRGEVLKEGDLK